MELIGKDVLRLRGCICKIKKKFGLVDLPEIYEGNYERFMNTLSSKIYMERKVVEEIRNTGKGLREIWNTVFSVYMETKRADAVVF